MLNEHDIGIFRYEHMHVEAGRAGLCTPGNNSCWSVCQNQQPVQHRMQKLVHTHLLHQCCMVQGSVPAEQHACPPHMTRYGVAILAAALSTTGSQPSPHTSGVCSRVGIPPRLISQQCIPLIPSSARRMGPCPSWPIPSQPCCQSSPCSCSPPHPAATRHLAELSPPPFMRRSALPAATAAVQTAAGQAASAQHAPGPLQAQQSNPQCLCWGTRHGTSRARCCRRWRWERPRWRRPPCARPPRRRSRAARSRCGAACGPCWAAAAARPRAARQSTPGFQGSSQTSTQHASRAAHAPQRCAVLKVLIALAQRHTVPPGTE